MSAVHEPKILASLPLFVDLGQEELSWINKHMIRKMLGSKKHILLASQPGETVYVIQEGTVKIHIEQSDGTDVTLAILGIGDIVGEMSLMDQAGRSANAVTIEKTTVLCMNKDIFRTCIREYPVFTENVMRTLTRRLRVANEQIQALSRLDVYGRVARMLLIFADQYGKEIENGDIMIPIRLTQSDIASLVGATRERVNKVIVDYKERKHISVDSKFHITIHNKKSLKMRIL